MPLPLPYSGQCLSNNECLEDKREELLCAVHDSCAQWYAETQAVLKVDCWFKFSVDLGLLFMFFCHIVLVLFAFVVLDLISSVLSQEIGCEEQLWNDLFCVKYDMKT